MIRSEAAAEERQGPPGGPPFQEGPQLALGSGRATVRERRERTEAAIAVRILTTGVVVVGLSRCCMSMMV